MRIALLCLPILAACIDTTEPIELETETASSALTNQYNLCVNGQVNAAELARMDREVHINPFFWLPIAELQITPGRAFLIHGSGYSTLPAGSYVELSGAPSGKKSRAQIGLTADGSLLVIPPTPLPVDILNLVMLRFDKSCGATTITRSWGLSIRQFGTTAPSPSSAGLQVIPQLTATATSSDTVRLTWRDNGPGGESGFLVWFRVRGAPSFTLAGSTVTDDTDEAIAPLLPGTEYELQVAAYDGTGFGLKSQGVFAKTFGGTPAPGPGTPPPSPGTPPPGAGTPVIPPPNPEDISFVELSEIAFPFNRPPLDCTRSALGAPNNCHFQVTMVGGIFDKRGDGVVGPANAGISSKLFPFEAGNNASAPVTGTEAIRGARYAPGANLIVLGIIDPVTGGGGRNVPTQFVAFHVQVAAGGQWSLIDMRGGDFMEGIDSLIMKLDGGVRTTSAGFTLPSGNTLGRIIGNSELAARLSGFDNRAMPNPSSPQQPSPYTAQVRLHVAAAGAVIAFDEQ